MKSLSGIPENLCFDMTIRVEPEYIDWENTLRINLYCSSTDLLVTAATDKETNVPQTGGNTTQGTAQATQDTTQTLQNTTQVRGEESN